VVGPDGRRTIAADDLFAGPMECTLAPGEIAVEAFFPALATGSGVAFEEVARRHGDYALVGVAALVTVDDERVTSARAGYLSVSDVPTVVDVTEALNGAVDGDSLTRAAEVALAGLEPAADIHATRAYREQLVRVLTARVLRRAYDDSRERWT
jgi:carbon-monoxide dehydrogenase medium subunit